MNEFVRLCPSCDKKVVYKNEKCYNDGIERNTRCKSCAAGGDKYLKFKTLTRICSGCGKEIFYKNKENLIKSESKNTRCQSCKQKGEDNHMSGKHPIALSGENHPMYGKHLSEETKKKISLSKKEKYLGINNPRFGKKMSKETRKKMSLSKKGKYLGINNPRFNTHLSDEQKSHLSKINIGKKLSQETKDKISKSNTGKKHTDEYKKLISYRQMGENNSFYGKIPTKEHREKLSKSNKGKIRSPEYRLKMSKSKTGKKHTDETRKKIRLFRIKEIERKFGQITPNYNPVACQYFNKLMDETNTHIQHAENGGEFYIPELGYWVDGYDEINNTIYEFDEKHHFDAFGDLKDKDIHRQNEIVKLLKCQFHRIKFNMAS